MQIEISDEVQALKRKRQDLLIPNRTNIDYHKTVYYTICTNRSMDDLRHEAR
jgi:hypothetical protein